MQHHFLWPWWFVIVVMTQNATAITYGVPDQHRHPGVGALVGTFDSETYPYCSGTLIAPTVFLTASHCDLHTSTVYITFDEQFVEEQSLLYEGTFYPHPEFRSRQNDPHDIAVVILDQPITGITPAQLPTTAQFDHLKGKQTFTAVGYGGLEMLPAPGGHTKTYPDARYYAVSSLNATNPAWLRLSQNPATGDGGTCYGDSGGPNFWGAGTDETTVIAGITITGDAVCRATNVIYRLDTPSARDFLGNFVHLTATK